MEEGANQAEAETMKECPMSTTFIGKKSNTHDQERLEEGGAIMPNQANRKIPSSADIVVNLATRRQSAGRTRVSQLSQADNSPIMPLTPTMAIMTEWL